MTRLTPEQIAEIKAHEAQTEREIQHNFGAAYSSRIEDAYQIHLDRKRLLSHIEADGWQTMETAPRDGTLVDLWVDVPAQVGGYFKAKSYRAANCQWLNDEWWQPDKITRLQGLRDGDYVTHWRPLPAPPETKEG